MSPRLTLIMDDSPLSLDVNPLLLDRIEDALSELGRWQELRDVSARHLEWNGSPRASLRLFQAHSALGCEESAAKALQHAISSLEKQPDEGLLAVAASIAEDGGHWSTLLKLRTLQWNASPESAGARLRWHRALRRVALGEHADEAVAASWQQRERDPQIYPRVARWLAQGQRWHELARLSSLEAGVSSNPGPSVVRWLDSLHRAGTLRPDDEAVRTALSKAGSSPELLRVLLKRASEWQCAWLSTEIRLAQLAGGAANHRALVGLHLRWLKEHARPEDAADFLDRVASIEGFSADDARSLRRLLLREGRLESLEQCLRRELRAGPGDSDPMLELAELADVRGNDAEADEWIAKARATLMAPVPSGSRRGDSEGTSDVAVRSIHCATESWIAQYVRAPTMSCEPPRLIPVIELLASMTQRRGRLPIWSGYGTSDVKSDDRMRSQSEVRIAPRLAVFLAHLARQLRPRLIVEIGTAFGVSGMYWVSALEETGTGAFVTFEPNAAWRQLAERNIGAISRRARLIAGTFEDQVASANLAAGSVDILSIDAIHTPEAVAGQLAIAAPLLSERSVVLIDDIQYSAEMYAYWQELAAMPGVEASFEIESRLGAIAGYPRRRG